MFPKPFPPCWCSSGVAVDLAIVDDDVLTSIRAKHVQVSCVAVFNHQPPLGWYILHKSVYVYTYIDL